MLDRKNFDELDDIKKMYKEKDFDAFLRVVQHELDQYKTWGDDEEKVKSITEATSFEAEAIQEAISNLALELADIKRSCDYWHELWECDRDDDAQSLINSYDWIVQKESMDRYEAKEKIVEAERGLRQGDVTFYVSGEITKSFYRNDNYTDIRQSVLDDLKSIGMYKPSFFIGTDEPVRYGRKENLKNIKEEDVMSQFSVDNITKVTLVPAKEKHDDIDTYDINIIKKDSE